MGKGLDIDREVNRTFKKVLVGLGLILSIIGLLGSIMLMLTGGSVSGNISREITHTTDPILSNLEELRSSLEGVNNTLSTLGSSLDELSGSLKSFSNASENLADGLEGVASIQYLDTKTKNKLLSSAMELRSGGEGMSRASSELKESSQVLITASQDISSMTEGISSISDSLRQVVRQVRDLDEIVNKIFFWVGVIGICLFGTLTVYGYVLWGVLNR